MKRDDIRQCRAGGVRWLGLALALTALATAGCGASYDIPGAPLGNYINPASFGTSAPVVGPTLGATTNNPRG